MTAEAAPMRPKRVFLSYAWESDEFKVWAKSLATRLRANGVDARLDEWHMRRNDNIAEFMNREVREADWVLVLCSPGYQQKVRATEDGARVSGVGWETRLLTSRVLVTNQNKVLAVLAKGDWEKAAPDSLLGQLYFDLSQLDTFEHNYKNLLTAITGTEEQAPALGPLPPIETGEPVGPLTGPTGQTTGQSPRSTGSGWLIREVAAILSIAVAIDLLLAWFVSEAVPSSRLTFREQCISYSLIALLMAGSLKWLARYIRARRRPAEV